MSILYTNIQRMCVHDGAGIRTTIFLKGCNLACPWCCNPENRNREEEYYFQQEKCKYSEKKGHFCSKCMILPKQFPTEKMMKDSICPFGYIGKYGKRIETEELKEILLKDKEYWGTEGGITFSGGEALLQIEQLEPLLEMLKEEEIHLALETALHISQEKLRIACSYIDFFYVDVKILDPETCHSVLHGNVELFLQNVELLIKEEKDVIFRVPCCDEYTLTDKNQKLLLAFFRKYANIPVEIFAVHLLGKKKYDSLGQKCLENLSNEKMASFYGQLAEQGNKVRIIHI